MNFCSSCGSKLNIKGGCCPSCGFKLISTSNNVEKLRPIVPEISKNELNERNQNKIFKTILLWFSIYISGNVVFILLCGLQQIINRQLNPTGSLETEFFSKEINLINWNTYPLILIISGFILYKYLKSIIVK